VRDPRSRKIYTKKEEKNYQLVFDKRLILNGGAETVPHGYFWRPPAEDANHNTVQQLASSVNLGNLYSKHCTLETENCDLGELFLDDPETAHNMEQNDDEIIDLMQTSDEEEDEDEYDETDLNFVDDEQSDTCDDPSFYRSMDNNEQYMCT